MKMYIGGWISHKESFETRNPANNKVIAKFPLGNKLHVEKAVKIARKSLKSFAAMPPPKRGEILQRIAYNLKKDKERLANVVCKEMGKVIDEARGDIQEAIDIFEYMAGEGRRLFGNTTTSELKNKFSMTIRMPVGVVGVITPWNFPIAVPAWKISAALICGNTVIFKPSSETPLCAYELMKIFEKSGVPKGVVSLVTGPSEVGKNIVTHPEIDGISFTGSKTTGEWIIANAGLKKVGLELGGKNPIIVMDDADLALAIKGIIWGAFGTSGQRCTAASRIIVHKKIHKKLLKMLLEATKKLKVGDPKKADIGPLVNGKAKEKCVYYVDIGKKEGAKLICGGYGKGNFFMPTIFDDVKKEMRIAKEEIFGPILSVIKFSTIDEAIDIANSVEYGLSSSIYTNNIAVAFKAIQEIQAGITYVNSSTIGSEVHLPFGGVKATGHTKEAGISGIDEFSNIKTVYIDYSGKLQKAQIE